MLIYTIGFTKKNAEQFFGLLGQPGLERVIDIRLNNVSQLAGFTKKNDLKFFLRAIRGLDYVHATELAPTREIMDGLKTDPANREKYERQFHDLLAERKVEQTLDKKLLDGGCLLCSEAEPKQCHRSLVVEYLKMHWDGVEVSHL